MRIIALTGGIGSGKSTVTRLFARLGIPTLSADELARAAVAPETPGLEALVREWGPSILAEDGSLDRKAVSARVFSHPEALQKLESIVHPEVRRLLAQACTALEHAGHTCAIYEIPLLFETESERSFSATIAVIASESIRIARVQARDTISEAEIRARMAQQVDDATRKARADHIIMNETDEAALRHQVDNLAQELGLISSPDSESR